MIDYSCHHYSSMPQGRFESSTRRSGFAASLAWSYRVLFWIGIGIATSLMFSPQRGAKSSGWH
ncbi:hypothetical protein DMB90_04200 [Raoultella planticola]|uniref:Uncharacterized protein n=1 Tax=Raoultella planticola TaxID=575 RepID=A0A5P6A970_RAOPL|nr:hypothetical protein DMB90_04200 [Raoultella planticola]